MGLLPLGVRNWSLKTWVPLSKVAQLAAGFTHWCSALCAHNNFVMSLCTTGFTQKEHRGQVKYRWLGGEDWLESQVWLYLNKQMQQSRIRVIWCIKVFSIISPLPPPPTLPPPPGLPPPSCLLLPYFYTLKNLEITYKIWAYSFQKCRGKVNTSSLA